VKGGGREENVGVDGNKRGENEAPKTNQEAFLVLACSKIIPLMPRLFWVPSLIRKPNILQTIWRILAVV
jgi:hypothetical protein